MPLTNYRDVGRHGSVSDAGFQFEFQCASCSQTWRSPFRPYRRGQLSGLIYRFAWLLGDRGGMFRATSSVSEAGADRARAAALREALELAEQRYAVCPSCRKAVCDECWDRAAQTCTDCAGKGRRQGAGGAPVARAGSASPTAEGAPALKCPNCSSAIGGGRFCPECGFDMASTHKTCPGCGTLCLRSARFCPDCGHGF